MTLTWAIAFLVLAGVLYVAPARSEALQRVTRFLMLVSLFGGMAALVWWLG